MNDMKQDTPVAVSRDNVSVAPGGQTSVQISGGTPPYTITIPPYEAVASAVLTDRNASPTTLVITGAPNATIGDNTSITVGDVDEVGGGGAGEIVAHGINSVGIFVSISSSPGISLQDDLQPLFTTTCGGAGCHIAGSSAPMSLEPGVSYGNLVGVNCTDGSCGATLRVDAGSALTSMLYLRVSGLTQCERMPFYPFVPGDSLTAAQQKMIQDWINQGAQNN
jgi:hypothetical protein